MVNRSYLARRLVMMMMSLLLVITLLFFLFRMVPGDPMASMVSPRMNEEVRQQVMEQFGLNEPLWKQYLLYLKGAVIADFGRSFYYNRPVTSIIADRLLNTLSLMLSAFGVSYLVGTYAGAVLGWLRGTKRERVGMLVVLLLRSTPVFWSGMILLYFFGFQLDLFPIGGMRDVTADYSGPIDKFVSVDFLHHLVLPVFTLSLYYTGLPLLLMRNNLLEVLSEDYIQTAKAKGISSRRVMINHAARNALLPVVTAFAIAIGFAVGGQVLIEQVFSWPGLGREMVQSSLRSDYPVAQGTFVLLSVIVITMNFLADLAYTYLDPRVTLGE